MSTFVMLLVVITYTLGTFAWSLWFYVQGTLTDDLAVLAGFSLCLGIYNIVRVIRVGVRYGWKS